MPDVQKLTGFTKGGWTLPKFISPPPLWSRLLLTSARQSSALERSQQRNRNQTNLAIIQWEEPGARGNGSREREGKGSGGRGASVELRGRRGKTLPQCSFLPLLLCSIRRLSQVGFTDSKSLATLNDSEVPDAAAHWRVVMSPEHSVTVSRKPRGYSTGPHS